MVFAYESLKGTPRKLLSILIFTAVIWNLFIGFGINEKAFHSFELLMGKTGIEEYKVQEIPAYKSISFINQNASSTERFLLLGNSAGYYLKRPYINVSNWKEAIKMLSRYLSTARTPAEFATALKADRIDYIVFNAKELEHQTKTQNLNPTEVQKIADVLKSMPAVFRENGVNVLAVH
jgi:hypothetical protein